jgi:hypothetical protein
MRYKGDREFSRKNAANAYAANLAARRGHNHSYMTDELYLHLTDSGYARHIFTETGSELIAIRERDNLRTKGHFARIVSTANKLRIRDYEVWYKSKSIKRVKSLLWKLNI